MLRSFRASPPSVSRLEQLCRQGDWKTVLEELSRAVEEEPISASSLLSSALRCPSGRVPLAVVQALYEAHPSNVAATHPHNGTTVLHEAILFNCREDVVDFLLDCMQHDCPDLLNQQDYLGRTPLHCLVVRWQQQCMRQTNGSTTEHYSSYASLVSNRSNSAPTTVGNLLQLLVTACPKACCVKDADGSTPLILLLQTTPTFDAHHEAELNATVRHMLTLCPESAMVVVSQRTWSSRATPWRVAAAAPTTARRAASGEEAGFHAPLYYAILHTRSADTIQLLIQTMNRLNASKGSEHHSDQGKGARTAVVTAYHETYLHVAVTVQSEAAVLQILVQHEPRAVLARDCYGLTPVDWLWISHVRDCVSRHSTRLSRTARRRHLANAHLEWHDQVSKQIRSLQSGTVRSGTGRIAAEDHRVDGTGDALLEEGLLSRMKVLMPAAGSMLHSGVEVPEWNLLHATCSVPCPLAMVQFVLAAHQRLDANDSASTSGGRVVSQHDSLSSTCDALRLRDCSGRYPLHYAAGRPRGYTAVLPVGISRGIKCLREESSAVHQILKLFPHACRVADAAGQLPLHSAIDAFKDSRRRSRKSSDAFPEVHISGATDEAEEDSVISVLLFHNSDALERKDEKTKLYPWMQAAVGDDARLTTIYRLFRFQPTIVPVIDA